MGISWLLQKALRSLNSSDLPLIPPKGLIAPCSSERERLGDDQIQIDLKWFLTESAGTFRRRPRGC